MHHIGKHLESEGRIKEAVEFYGKAKCFNQAIRLAKEHGMDNELMHLAIQGSKESMIDAARYVYKSPLSFPHSSLVSLRYYESNPKFADKAISLYFKGGNLSKALDLCFQSRQFALLRDIAQSIDAEKVDPKLLTKCAEFFMEHGQFDKAVRMLVSGKKAEEAIQLCVDRQVIITEELADDISNSFQDEGRKKKVDLKIADLCNSQKSYHLACKKYTQAGDRLKAMTALLRSGDTEKIVFYASKF